MLSTANPASPNSRSSRANADRSLRPVCSSTTPGTGRPNEGTRRVAWICHPSEEVNATSVTSTRPVARPTSQAVRSSTGGVRSTITSDSGVRRGEVGRDGGVQCGPILGTGHREHGQLGPILDQRHVARFELAGQRHEAEDRAVFGSGVEGGAGSRADPGDDATGIATGAGGDRLHRAGRVGRGDRDGCPCRRPADGPELVRFAVDDDDQLHRPHLPPPICLPLACSGYSFAHASLGVMSPSRASAPE